MFNLILKNKLLVLVLLMATVLRLWGLGQNPPHLTSDEAALGYNAYSILKTGRDEHGELLPIIFKSFGDWKPGLYIYLDVPVVVILGLNEFAVRLPGALAGVLTVFLIYLITKKLFNNKKLALMSAFFLSVSPWHLQFSRGAWEAGVALSLVLLGTYFFLEGLEKKRNYLFISAIFFALTLWTYQGAKLSTAIFLFSVIVVFRKEIINLPKRLVFKVLLVGALTALPVVFSMFQGKTGRLDVYNIFSYRRSEETIQTILDQDGINKNSPTFSLFHSENIAFTRGILWRWLNHFSPKFFFFEGDWGNTRHTIPNAGVILLADVFFLIFGLIALSRRGAGKETMLIWLWLLLLPLPAAFSRDSIHAVRTLGMVIPLSIILSLGSEFLWEHRRSVGKILPILLFVFGISYLVNYGYYLDQYWVHAPRANSKDWQYGLKQMVQKLTPIMGKYQEIVVKQDYSQPYIFFLFYQKYDPAKYQKISKDVYIANSSGDVGLVSRLDNITFREINWSADRGMHGKLFVIDPIKVPIEDSSSPREFNQIDQINFLNGQTAFRFLEIR